MLDLLKHKNISLGTKLEIRKRFSVDNSVEIRIRNQSPVTISEHVAKNVFVKNVE
jgi:DtxR family transcriptional regulator, Mn-dependent transcriptional regulator